MNLKVFSIIVMVVGGILYTTGGHFPLLPDEWFRGSFRAGKVFLIGGFGLLLLAAIEAHAETNRKITDELREAINALTNKLGSVYNDASKKFGDFGDDYLGEIRDANDVQRGLANIKGKTALADEQYVKIAGLLEKLKAPAEADVNQPYVETAKDLIQKLLTLQVTRDGLKGPALIAKVEAFLAAYDAAVVSQKAAKEAKTALGTADKAHSAEMAKLNDFDADD